MTNDLVKQLAESYKQRLESKREQDAHSQRQEQLLNTVGPRRWAELRNLIKSRRDRFNQEIGYEALSWEAQGQSFSITRDLDGAVLEGVYDPVSCFGALTSEKLQIDRKINAVIIDDDVQFCTNPEDDDPLRREPGHRRIRLDDNTGSEVEKLEEIAERLITDFLSF